MKIFDFAAPFPAFRAGNGRALRYIFFCAAAAGAKKGYHFDRLRKHATAFSCIWINSCFIAKP